MVAEQETAIPDTYRGVIAHVVFVQRPDGTYRAERPTYTPTVITDPKTYGATRVLDATHPAPRRRACRRRCGAGPRVHRVGPDIQAED